MLVQSFTTRFSNIGEQLFLRCDPKYRYFWDRKHGQVLPGQKSIPLRQILQPIPKKVLSKGTLNEEYRLVGIDTSEPRDGQLRNLSATTEIGSDKLLLKDADLIVGKLGMTRGYIFDNTMKGENLIGSTELIPYRFMDSSYYPAFLKYLLLLPAYLSACAYLQSGKTPSHWRVNPLDFLRIMIPVVARDTQSLLLKRVAPLQARINRMKGALSSGLDILDRVFAREFGYSLEEYEELAKQNTYQKALTDIDKSFLLRSSVRFQHPKYEYVDRILSRYPWVKLKTQCADRVRRGVQPRYSPDGEVLVVKTLNLRNEYLDFSDSEHVTQEFLEANPEAGIKQNDVLVSSTGEGRGKVDIYEFEYPAIADTHISIIHLKDGVNPYYVLYFMRSLLGKLQLETLEMAIKGTPEIYWYQLEQMRIIDAPRNKQDAIVEEVTAELQEIERQRAEIQRIRDEIDEVLVETISKEAKE